ncbi:alpha-taxilin-like [Canna indica]|uniref:Alpha-taxilin-like n=1 Tax=Canna indica TaxID=4628 RepID=A0AAQ3K476_9LILI|nr:alpha-taxilin-like [Canna indica]
METSPANRLPEADSLPDGFVEVLPDPSPSPPLPPSDYKEAFLDHNPSGELHVDPSPPPSISSEETLTSGNVVDDTKKCVISADFLRSGNSVGDCSDSMGQDGILKSKPEDGASESIIPKDEVSIGTSLEGNGQADCQSSERETQAQMELQVTNLAQMELHATNLKETSEAKRKVVKRNTKTEKELLEFTLNYQKVVAERDAAVAVRERLESLCRELQRQNKILMDECQRVSTEGQNMRQDLSTKFNDAIKDITNKLEVQKDECLSQLNENEMLRNKLKLLADQYSLSEQHFSKKLQQKSLELQLADLKLQQQEEKSAQEQSQMQLYAEQVSQLMATEKTLRLQLASDEERFQQFQDALSKSNEVFEAFKQEMEKMAKLIKELKKENEFLKGKCEKSDIALVKLIEEREAMKKQMEKVKSQKEKLESLCRSLQAERKHALVKANSDPVGAQDGLKSSVSPDARALVNFRWYVIFTTRIAVGTKRRRKSDNFPANDMEAIALGGVGPHKSFSYLFNLLHGKDQDNHGIDGYGIQNIVYKDLLPYLGSELLKASVHISILTLMIPLIHIYFRVSPCQQFTLLFAGSWNASLRRRGTALRSVKFAFLRMRNKESGMDHQSHRIAALIAILFIITAKAGAVLHREASVPEMSTTEMYEIDYRGPETHSSLPPPELPSIDSLSEPSRKTDVGRKRIRIHG